MKTIIASLLIKFFMILIAAWLAVTFIAANAWTWALWLAVITTVVSYIVGDRFILPNYGKNIATLADGLLAVAILFIMDLASPDLRIRIMSLVSFGLLVAAAEHFFHRYLAVTDTVDL